MKQFKNVAAIPNSMWIKQTLHNHETSHVEGEITGNRHINKYNLVIELVWLIDSKLISFLTLCCVCLSNPQRDYVIQFCKL